MYSLFSPPSTVGVASSAAVSDFQESTARTFPEPVTGRLSSRSEEATTRQPAATRSPRSCFACQKSKVKCDRNHPCSRCTKKHMPCEYPSNYKRRPRGPGKPKLQNANVEETKKRLAKLESWLERLSEHMKNSVSDNRHDGKDSTDKLEGRHNKAHLCTSEDSRLGTRSDSTSTTTITTATTPTLNHLLESDSSSSTAVGFNSQDIAWILERNGKSLYISNAFWASLSNEVENIRETLDCEPGDLTSGLSEDRAISPISGPCKLATETQYSLSALQDLFPPTTHIQKYWRIFLHNVDPVFHILHKLEAVETVQKAIFSSGELESSEMVLIFVIFFSVINSMSEQEVKTEFREIKSTLQDRYKYAVDHALRQAGHICTKELRTLQAFVLFIICLRRHYNAHHIWMLVGLTIRIALGLGLHRDGENFGLDPYQTEMRRRLWWHIFILELRAAEDQGCNSTLNEESFDTKLPLNLNDEDLKQNTKDPFSPHVGFTDMTICLIRFETSLLSHQIQSDIFARPGKITTSTIEEKLKLVAACEERQQVNYLQNISSQKPESIVASVLTKTFALKLKLMIQSPFHRIGTYNSNIPRPSLHDYSGGATRESMLHLSIAILEYSVFLSTDPSVKQWAWASRKYIFWHPLTIILLELCHQPVSNLTIRAWNVVNSVLQSGDVQPDATACDGRDAVLWRLITKLIAKAKQHTKVDFARSIDSACHTTKQALNHGIMNEPACYLDLISPQDKDKTLSLNKGILACSSSDQQTFNKSADFNASLTTDLDVWDALLQELQSDIGEDLNFSLQDEWWR